MVGLILVMHMAILLTSVGVHSWTPSGLVRIYSNDLAPHPTEENAGVWSTLCPLTPLGLDVTTHTVVSQTTH